VGAFHASGCDSLTGLHKPRMLGDKIPVTSEARAAAYGSFSPYHSGTEQPLPQSQHGQGGRQGNRGGLRHVAVSYVDRRAAKQNPLKVAKPPGAEDEN